MEMAWLANASEHFDKLQAGRYGMNCSICSSIIVS